MTYLARKAAMRRKDEKFSIRADDGVQKIFVKEFKEGLEIFLQGNKLS